MLALCFDKKPLLSLHVEKTYIVCILQLQETPFSMFQKVNKCFLRILISFKGQPSLCSFGYSETSTFFVL